jgi:hypothetical protein
MVSQLLERFPIIHSQRHQHLQYETPYFSKHPSFASLLKIVVRGMRRESVGDDFTPKTSKKIHPTRKAAGMLLSLQHTPGGSTQESKYYAERMYTRQ